MGLTAWQRLPKNDPCSSAGRMTRGAIVLLSLSLFPLAPASAAAPSAEQIQTVLTSIAQGRDKEFGAAVAPALGTDSQRPPADRSAALISRMSQEAAAVTAAFIAAPDADKVARTKESVARFDPETARDGAARLFEGNGPSISILRQLLVVPAATLGADPAGRVMQVVSSFEHSPKTDDNYYEYANSADLKTSQVTDMPGSATSWTTQARPPMAPGKAYALKKCRHIPILGWYCNTSLYEVRDLPGSNGATKLLLTFLRPLPKGGDNPRFTDGRAENIVDGYTAFYVVTAAGNSVLVYSVGIQSKADAPSQQGRLNEGQKAEYRQLFSRIQGELGLGKLP